MTPTTPIRFQVNKRVALALKKRHPWIYRGQCSSALDAIPVGSLVKLFGPTNEFLGIGLYEPYSAIAIRVLSFDHTELPVDHFDKILKKAWAKRQNKISKFKTNAFRWVHGEADGLPGLTIDVYGHTAIAVFHLETLRPLMAEALWRIAKEFDLEKLYLRPRKVPAEHKQLVNLLTGIEEIVKEPLWFDEQDWSLPCFPLTGQKTGYYLDLRELRTILARFVKPDQSVLNL
ncbi:MAG: Methyltransferase, partial [uncultured bacterium]